MLNYPDFGALALGFIGNPDLIIPMWYFNKSWEIYMTDDVMVSLDTLSANPKYGLRRDGLVWGLHHPSKEDRRVSMCGKPILPVSYVNSNAFDASNMRRAMLEDFEPNAGIIFCSKCSTKPLAELIETFLND